MRGSQTPSSIVAVVIPCFNEEKTVSAVIDDFRQSMPCADVHVCGNGSTDRTAEVAQAAGAIPLSETQRGKGNAVRRLFSDADADIYILVDGDDTYDASSAPDMADRLIRGSVEFQWFWP